MINLAIATFVSDDWTKVCIKVREGVARKGGGMEGEGGGEKERGTRQEFVRVDVYRFKDVTNDERLREYFPI